MERLKNWVDLGIEEIDFFIHQNHEQESPLLTAHFIRRLNAELGTSLRVPNSLNDEGGLFCT